MIVPLIIHSKEITRFCVSGCKVITPSCIQLSSFHIILTFYIHYIFILIIPYIWYSFNNYPYAIKSACNLNQEHAPYTRIRLYGFKDNYSWLSLPRTRKGPANLFEIERVWDRERKIGYSLHKGTETLVRHRERFEIEGVRDRESQL